MARYLIEVPHEGTMEACNAAIEAFLNSGSHFLTHADWGCPDGVHSAWLVVELDDKESARAILPPYFRESARIVELKKYTFADRDEAVGEHTDPD